MHKCITCVTISLVQTDFTILWQESKEMQRRLAETIGKWCFEKSRVKEESKTIVIYGIELFLNTFLKAIGLLILGLCFGVLGETIIAMSTFYFLRISAGGVHSRSNMGCFLSMVGVCWGAIVTDKIISTVSYEMCIGIMIVACIFLYLYSPSHTQNNPIIDIRIRKKKRMSAIIKCILLVAIAMLVPKVQVLILVPVIIEVFTILPIANINKLEGGLRHEETK